MRLPFRGIAVTSLYETIAASIGQSSRYFPLNREFFRFAGIPGYLAAKSASRISGLLVDSRSDPKREFKRA
jgi:hypothetical protein